MQLRIHWMDCVFTISDEMYLPSTGIWLPRAVLHKHRFTCNLLISYSAFGEVSHTFQYRRYMSSWTLSNLCILLCIVVVVVTFLCCCCFCYCVMFLLFICNYGCTIRDKKQQQHEIVTTMTTTHSNLHWLLSVQDTMQFYMGKNTDILPLLTKPTCTVPNYTRQVCANIPQVRCTAPQLTPLAESPTTPGQHDLWQNRDHMDPLLQHHVQRVLLHQDSMTYNIIQMRWTPQLTPLVESPTTPGHDGISQSTDQLDTPNQHHVQSPTTPGQYDLWDNTDEMDPPIDPTCRECYYTRTV